MRFSIKNEGAVVQITTHSITAVSTTGSYSAEEAFDLAVHITQAATLAKLAEKDKRRSVVISDTDEGKVGL